MVKKMKVKPARFSKIVSKFLVLVIITLICLILLKSNANLRDFIYKKVFQDNLSFAKINEIYKKNFGSSLPLYKEEKNVTKLVSSNKLNYSKAESYKEGVKLTVDNNYVVSSMDSGLIIFSGNKEGYGNTIVVQRPDNVEVWYSNLKNTNVSLYDYVKQGDNIAEVEGTVLYLVFYKEGKALDYKQYI